MSDPKRELLRHLLATISFRASVAVGETTESFSAFKLKEDMRTPSEILAHLGDLLEGSLFLLNGEMRLLNSLPLPWHDEISRFFAAVQKLDLFLASGTPIAIPVEKLVQGPIADALTHIGQINMLRRSAGIPVRSAAYFQTDIVPGEIYFTAPEVK